MNSFMKSKLTYSNLIYRALWKVKAINLALRSLGTKSDSCGSGVSLSQETFSFMRFLSCNHHINYYSKHANTTEPILHYKPKASILQDY